MGIPLSMRLASLANRGVVVEKREESSLLLILRTERSWRREIQRDVDNSEVAEDEFFVDEDTVCEMAPI